MIKIERILCPTDFSPEADLALRSRWRKHMHAPAMTALPAGVEHKLAALFRHLPHLTPVESKMKSGAEQAILFRIRIERITGVCERWQ